MTTFYPEDISHRIPSPPLARSSLPVFCGVSRAMVGKDGHDTDVLSVTKHAELFSATALAPRYPLYDKAPLINAEGHTRAF